MSATTRLLLVRHGETPWNASRTLQGQADIPLSARGGQQIARLRAAVESFAPTRAVASDLQRTRQSAALLGYAQAPSDPRWREADLGDWTGASIGALRQSAPEDYRAWREGRLTPAGAEPFGDLSARVGAAAAALLGAGETVLVVTHGGPIRALCARWLALPPARVVPVSPGSLTVLEIGLEPGSPAEPSPEEGRAKLHTFNWTPFGALSDPPD